jgi:hypothetical protein
MLPRCVLDRGNSKVLAGYGTRYLILPVLGYVEPGLEARGLYEQRGQVELVDRQRLALRAGPVGFRRT